MFFKKLRLFLPLVVVLVASWAAPVIAGQPLFVPGGSSSQKAPINLGNIVNNNITQNKNVGIGFEPSKIDVELNQRLLETKIENSKAIQQDCEETKQVASSCMEAIKQSGISALRSSLKGAAWDLVKNKAGAAAGFVSVHADSCGNLQVSTNIPKPSFSCPAP